MVDIHPPMSERGSYLSQILGNGALRVRTFDGLAMIWGEVHAHDNVEPLTDVVYHSDGSASLLVTQAHRAGHFLGVETLPSYRMVELAGLLGHGQPVVELTDASFSKIITPGDLIVAQRDKLDVLLLARQQNGKSQHIARIELVFGENGVSPYQLGLLLEVAAQTAVVNIVGDFFTEGELVYPLILGVENIITFSSQPHESLTAIPTYQENPAKNGFSADVQIRNQDQELVANVSHLLFKFATAKQIAFYETLGRNWR